MSYFLRNGTTWKVTDKADLDLHEHLPAGNYIIKQDQFSNMFLEEIDAFTAPPRLYGDTTRHADRILNTFRDRPASTGVVLNGEKGSGKTLLAKTLSMRGAEEGIPTIVINAPWHGDRFNSLIQSIDQPCMVLFDEFEKVYDSDQQQAILTLLDGVFPSKTLFVITCNDKWRIDSHMRNRPGRIFYMLDFKGLEVNFIREYCEDNLNNKSHIDTVCKFSVIFSSFNFDMLKALVEEMNRYDESPAEAMRMLNAKPEYGENSSYEVQLILNGAQTGGDTRWRGNPLMQEFSIDYISGKDDDGDDNWETLRVSPSDLKKVDTDQGVFVFTVPNGLLRLQRERVKDYGYSHLF
jgi:hypothetical protein